MPRNYWFFLGLLNYQADFLENSEDVALTINQATPYIKYTPLSITERSPEGIVACQDNYNGQPFSFASIGYFPGRGYLGNCNYAGSQLYPVPGQVYPANSLWKQTSANHWQCGGAGIPASMCAMNQLN